MNTTRTLIKISLPALAGVAMLATQLQGGSAHAEEGVQIGVGELQECTISKSMDTSTTTLAQYAINGNSLDGGHISYTGLEAPAAGDGDTDGRDFLIWQRGGSPTPSGSDLADWQANYGTGG